MKVQELTTYELERLPVDPIPLVDYLCSNGIRLIVGNYLYENARLVSIIKGDTTWIAKLIMSDYTMTREQLRDVILEVSSLEPVDPKLLKPRAVH